MHGHIFYDALTPDLAVMHGVKEFVYSLKTKYTQLDVVRTYFGVSIFMDMKMQSTEADEFIYHEGLVHPAMLAHPNPKRVMIIGGGEGATLREVLRHRSVERVVMVDIDEDFVEFCKQHLEEWHQKSFDDPRARVYYDDAREYLKALDEKGDEEDQQPFDVIVIDISEPVKDGPACPLYTREFYKTIWNRLTPGGTISLQAGSTAAGSMECLSALHNTIKSVFTNSHPYQLCIPSFGLPWGFILAVKWVGLGTPEMDISPELVDVRITKRIGKDMLRFYDGTTHRGIFNLPKHVRAYLDAETRVIRDNEPMYIHN